MAAKDWKSVSMSVETCDLVEKYRSALSEKLFKTNDSKYLSLDAAIRYAIANSGVEVVDETKVEYNKYLQPEFVSAVYFDEIARKVLEMMGAPPAFWQPDDHTHPHESKNDIARESELDVYVDGRWKDSPMRKHLLLSNWQGAIRQQPNLSFEVPKAPFTDVSVLGSIVRDNKVSSHVPGKAPIFPSVQVAIDHSPTYEELEKEESERRKRAESNQPYNVSPSKGVWTKVD